MPTSYPFPHVARIALSLMVSLKRVDRTPRMTEVQPWERAEITTHTRHGFTFAPGVDYRTARYEGI